MDVARALVSAVLDTPDKTAHADCLLALNQLFNPTGTHALGKDDLAALGGLETCHAVLRDDDSSPAAKEQAAKLLRALCTNDKEAQDYAASLGVVPCVVELISRQGLPTQTGVTPSLRLWLVCALRVVTTASSAALEAARDSGAIDVLAHLTRASPSPDARDAAREALSNFASPPARGNVGPLSMTGGGGGGGGERIDLSGSVYVPGGTGSSQDAGGKSQWYTQYPVWSTGVATRGIGGQQMPWAVKDHRGRLLQG